MKNNLILTLIAGIIFCSCDNKEKQIDEALSKAVACAELGTVEYTITKLIITDDDHLNSRIIKGIMICT